VVALPEGEHAQIALFLRLSEMIESLPRRFDLFKVVTDGLDAARVVDRKQLCVGCLLPIRVRWVGGEDDGGEMLVRTDEL
jgi:hypothetical protein